MALADRLRACESAEGPDCHAFDLRLVAPGSWFIVRCLSHVLDQVLGARQGFWQSDAANCRNDYFLHLHVFFF